MDVRILGVPGQKTAVFQGGGLGGPGEVDFCTCFGLYIDWSLNLCGRRLAGDRQENGRRTAGDRQETVRTPDWQETVLGSVSGLR